MTALNPSHDASPRSELRRAIRSVERERVGGIGFALIFALGGFLRYGHTYTTGPEVLLAAVLALLVFLYIQVCGLRIDAYRRELGRLPPHL